MTIDKNQMEYRKKASAIIFDSENRLLLVQLHDYDEHQWNVPGGGIEVGETPLTAIRREMEEELGTTHFELVEQSKIIDRYDFPDQLIERIINEGRNYRGQEQIQFIFKFTGKDSEIKIQEDEIRKYKWVPLSKLEEHLVFPNQLENILNVIENSALNIK